MIHLLWIIPLSAVFGFAVGVLMRKTGTRTNADRFRAMSDIELARFLMRAHDCELNIPFCQEKQECIEMIDKGDIVPDEKCLRCMVAWLQREAE